jgi:hypothetical protein
MKKFAGEEKNSTHPSIVKYIKTSSSKPLAPVSLTPRRKTVSKFIGDGVVLRTVLEIMVKKKFLLLRGIEFRSSLRSHSL